MTDALQFSVSIIRLFQLTPSCIFDFSKKQSGAHFRIVTCTVMLAFGYIEQFTKIPKRITAKVIIVTRCTKCTILVNIRSFKVIELQRLANTWNVECCIVCNKYRCVSKIFKYLRPNLWKLWSILRIFRMNTMDLYVPVGIRIILRTQQKWFGL